MNESIKELAARGFRPGELHIIASRGTGKSMLGPDWYFTRPVTALRLSEGRGSGSCYYCVEPVGGNWLEMEAWCIQTCGESTYSIWAEEKYKHAANAGERWYGNNRKFWFREEQDRTMFVLRWS